MAGSEFANPHRLAIGNSCDVLLRTVLWHAVMSNDRSLAVSTDRNSVRGLHVGIVTTSADLHTDVVAALLRERGHTVSVVLGDGSPGYGALTWSSAHPTRPLLRTAAGTRITPADLDVVWWRRAGRPTVPDRVVDSQAREYVASANAVAVFGVWLSAVRGRWVSHPDATRHAENKIVQLRAAISAGLRIPRTLISQHPGEIREFAASLGPGRMIGKPVTGVLNLGLATGVITEAMLCDDDALAIAPTIYQELVPGHRHLRVSCFGTHVIPALIEADQLDWRYEKNYRVRSYELDSAIERQLLGVLDQLHLAMGIFDLKLDGDDAPIWLEVNPQGQFLFLEARGGPTQLATAMADLLIDEGSRSMRM